MATLVVDKGLCSKNGNCINVCPSVFEWDTDGFAKVKDGADTSQPCVEQAITECPESAIYWT
jgi:ferredoxin